MQELHLVGFTTDRRNLIFSARQGAKSGSFLVPVDEELIDAVGRLVDAATDHGATSDEDLEEEVVEAAADTRVDARLSVREVQARLRAGDEVDDIAERAGVEPGWVERFAPPIRAEQQQIVTKALTVPMQRPRVGSSGVALGDAVARSMAERDIGFTAESFAAAWSARLIGSDLWSVEFTFDSRGRSRTVSWTYDTSERRLTTSDRFASQIGFVADDGRSRRSATPEVASAPASDDAEGSGTEPATQDGADDRGAAPRKAPTAKKNAGRKKPAAKKTTTAKKKAAKKSAAAKKSGPVKKQTAPRQKTAAGRKAAAAKKVAEKRMEQAAAKRIAAAKKAAAKRKRAADRKAIADKKAAAERARAAAEQAAADKARAEAEAKAEAEAAWDRAAAEAVATAERKLAQEKAAAEERAAAERKLTEERAAAERKLTEERADAEARAAVDERDDAGEPPVAETAPVDDETVEPPPVVIRRPGPAGRPARRREPVPRVAPDAGDARSSPADEPRVRLLAAPPGEPAEDPADRAAARRARAAERTVPTAQFRSGSAVPASHVNGARRGSESGGRESIPDGDGSIPETGTPDTGTRTPPDGRRPRRTRQLRAR